MSGKMKIFLFMFILIMLVGFLSNCGKEKTKEGQDTPKCEYVEDESGETVLRCEYSEEQWERLNR